MALVVLASLLLLAAAVVGYFGYGRPEARGASLAQMSAAVLLTAFAGVACMAFYYGSADWTIMKSQKASGDATAPHISGAAEGRDSTAHAGTRGPGAGGDVRNSAADAGVRESNSRSPASAASDE